MPRWVVPRTSPSKKSSCARTSKYRHSTIVRYIRSRVSRSMSGTVVAMRASWIIARSVRVGDEELVGWEAGDDLRAVGCDDDLLFDPRRGVTILRRAIGLEGDDHPLLELDGVLERIEPADDRSLVEEQADAVTELEPEAFHLVVEPELLCLRPDARHLVGGDPRAHELDGRVDPLAGLLVCIPLCVGALADDEGPVVAGLVADERMDDVEERLVAGPDDPVREDVRMRAAPLARDCVDVVDVLGAEIEQVVRDVCDELALANAWLQLLRQQLVRAVDHRAGDVQQRDLVLRLDLAGIEHDLLAVSDGDPLVGECRRHRRLDDVHADGHVGDAFGPQDRRDLASGRAEEPGVWRDRPAQADHPGVDVLLAHPRAVQAMVLGRGSEVPDVRVAATR